MVMEVWIAEKMIMNILEEMEFCKNDQSWLRASRVHLSEQFTMVRDIGLCNSSSDCSK